MPASSRVRAVGRRVGSGADVVDIPENVGWADRRGRGGNAGIAVREIVSPDADIAVAALRFDPVVPAMVKLVAVDIAVAVRKAAPAEVRVASHNVVEAVIVVRAEFVVTDHEAAGRID